MIAMNKVRRARGSANWGTIDFVTQTTVTQRLGTRVPRWLIRAREPGGRGAPILHRARFCSRGQQRLLQNVG